MVKELLPQSSSERLLSIIDGLSNEEKKEMLDLLSKEIYGDSDENSGKRDGNLELNFNLGKDFEELDLGSKVNRIFERLGDTDCAADLIMDLITSPIESYGDRRKWKFSTIKTQRIYKNKIFKEIMGSLTIHDLWYSKIKNKFGSGPVALRILLFMMDDFDRNNWSELIYMAFCDDGNSKKNVTEKTVKAFQEGSNAAKRIAKNYFLK